MRFIYEPNKPEQNILCGRLQSVLLWLEMKLKNVSETSQRNTFVTFFFPSESSIVAFVFQGFVGFFYDGGSCMEQAGPKPFFWKSASLRVHFSTFTVGLSSTFEASVAMVAEFVVDLMWFSQEYPHKTAPSPLLIGVWLIHWWRS